MPAFLKPVEIRWSDIDANRHMRHSAYADLCTHARVEWLQATGFGADYFARHGFGPVLFKESTEYLREARLGDRLTVDVELLGASADAARWRFRQTMRRDDGVAVAVHEVAGAWLDLAARKLIAPPDAMQAAMATLPKCADFAELPAPRDKAAADA
ncbi:acyl-CoA thioesterase [Crenobacter cavernae]|uniref:Thioesterase n=1 Tax=Crenobacter cavernae TaxID=2290923 RepID=A0ABY0FGR2_9NEIS|nr:acyl-CoA thioesterase [Crenobacter cavernae]RXZ44374.1 thioesterase [Crenobacter cavernae]